MSTLKTVRLARLWCLAAALPLLVRAGPELRQDFICVSGGTQRVITLVSFDPSDRQPRGACRVDYSKDGQTKTMWSSSTGRGYCAAKATSLVTSLEEAHWSCKPRTAEAPDDAERSQTP